MRTLSTILLLGCLNASGQFPAPAEPAELQKLTAQWQKAREQVTAPIDKKYLDALAAMKVTMTKQGNLEGALAVDARIKSLTANASIPTVTTTTAEGGLPKTKNSLEKFLVGTTWTVTGAKNGRFIGDMEFTSSSMMMFQKEREWTVTDKRIITVEGNVVKFNEDMTGFTVTWGASGDEIGTFKSRKPSQ